MRRRKLDAPYRLGCYGPELLCQPSLFQQGVVGAFAWGFGSLTSDFGVGKSQDLGC